MSKFQEMMESTLDMSLVDRGEFLIRAEFDDELKGRISRVTFFFSLPSLTLNFAVRNALENGALGD